MRSLPSFVVLSFLFGGRLLAQDARLVEPRLFGGYGIGMELGKMLPDSGEAFKQLPWFSGQVELGASLLMNDRWGLAVGGLATFNGRYYYTSAEKIRLYHLLLRTEARLWWQTPWKRSADSWLRIGCAFGFSHIGPAYHDRVEEGFEAHSRSNEHKAPYLAPEVGLMRVEDGPHRIEVGIRYLVHLDRAPAIVTVLTTPSSSTHATSVHDQLSIVMRYHLGFKRRERPPLPAPAVAYERRSTDTLVTLHTRNASIRLELWDDAEVDGDSISVLLNERPVLAGYGLTHRHKNLRVALERGSNRFLVVAHNEGRVPPNTARAIVHGVKGAPRLLLKTSAHQNQLVEVVRELSGVLDGRARTTGKP